MPPVPVASLAVARCATGTGVTHGVSLRLSCLSLLVSDKKNENGTTMPIASWP